MAEASAPPPIALHPAAMRALWSIPTLLVLAACEGAPQPSPPEQIRAYFPPGGVVDTIEIDATERLPLRSAELLAPDGHTLATGLVSLRPSPTATFSQQFPTGPYSAGSFGISNAVGANPLGAAVVGAAPQTQTTLLATISTASIPVPDPLAYRRDWQKYRIQLRFGAPPGEIQTRDIPAPPPPPA
ncbi:MAG TPA: hypothetical protein VGF34_00735 [Stellaceae bacterium]